VIDEAALDRAVRRFHEFLIWCGRRDNDDRAYALVGPMRMLDTICAEYRRIVAKE
jgi:hypothetical protein